MTMDKYPQLRLENQLCFPLYACSKEIVRRYTPFLDPLGLTYTQYLVMMVMWEKESINIKELGEILFLDSGTLTPVVKKLESKGLLLRKRCPQDERCVILTLLPAGYALADEAAAIPEKMGGCVCLSKGEAQALYASLYKILGGFCEEK